MLQLDFVDQRFEEIDFSDTNTLFNIDTIFSGIPIEYNDYNIHMISSIDKGKVPQREDKRIFGFIDRFGIKLGLDKLSTGCKAAIMLGLNLPKRVALIECGDNALLEIVKHCRTGRALMLEPMDGVPDTVRTDTQIDVCIGKYRLNTLSNFS